MSADGGLSYVRGLAAGTPLAGTIGHIAGATDRDDVAFIDAPLLYRTDDGGLSWRAIATPAAGGPAALAVDRRGDVLLLGASNGIFKSTDGGAAWVSLAGGLPAPPFAAGAVPAIDPAESKRMAAIVPSIGSYRSSDGGLSWQRTGGAPFSCCLAPLFVSGDTMWAVINGGIAARSRDAGATWGGLPLPSTGSWEAFVRDSASGALYLGSRAVEFGAGLYRSTDGGDSWKADSAGPGSGAVSNLAADPGHALYAMGWGTGVHAMPGRKAAWRDVTPASASFVTGRVTTPVLVTGPQALMVSGRDFWRSEDGGANWTLPPTGYVGNRIDLLAARPGSPATVYGVAEIVDFAGYSPYVAALAPRRSQDAGATWTAIDAGLPIYVYQLVATGSARLIATTNAGVWTSDDDGTSWIPRPEVDGTARAMLARPGNPDTLFVVTSAGVYRSRSGGIDFERMSDLPDPDATFVAPDMHPSEGVHLVTRAGAVYSSADDGRTWSSLGGSLVDLGISAIRDVVVSPWSAATLYAATDRGVLKFVARPDVTLVQEFHHAAFDHYFMTASRSEAATLVSGQIDGWRSTGQRLAVVASGAASPPNLPVCRFFSASFAPRSSHFYTPYADECAEVKAGSAWTFEGIAFALALPEGSPGARECPTGMQPLFRVYNNYANGAPNHRYTIDAGILDRMTARGWIMEGDAATRVFACVPAQD